MNHVHASIGEDGSSLSGKGKVKGNLDFELTGRENKESRKAIHPPSAVSSSTAFIWVQFYSINSPFKKRVCSRVPL